MKGYPVLYLTTLNLLICIVFLITLVKGFPYLSLTLKMDIYMDKEDENGNEVRHYSQNETIMKL